MSGSAISAAITNVGLCGLIAFGIYWTNTCWPLWGLVFIQYAETTRTIKTIKGNDDE